MNLQHEIFAERVRLDIREQPDFKVIVQELTAWFQQNSAVQHPYDQDFCSLSSFLQTCTGAPARLDPVQYVYRVAKVSAIFYKDQPRPEFRGVSSPKLFQSLLDRQRDLARMWLDLSFYFPAGAILPAKRNCSWWTPAVVPQEPLLPSAHKSGMPNDWVNLYTVLLRIPAAEFARIQLKIPTPVDAFDSCIFLAQPVPGAKAGTAIDLAQPPTFGKGNTETVARDIEVEIIEALPIEVNDEQREKFPVDLVPLLPLLLDYYRNL